MRVLVVGCGEVGATLGRLLVADGHEVFGLRRSPNALPPAIQPVAADVTDRASLARIPEGLDAVVYAVAPGGRSGDRYHTAYVEGPTNVLCVLRDRGEMVRRLLFASSTAVYGQTNGEWVDEDSRAEPERPTARLVREGEEIALGSPFPTTVIRFAGIYGPGRTRLVRSVLDGTAVCPEGPPVWTNRIHRDDCAGALRHLLGIEAPASLYVAADHEPADRCEVLRWLAGRLGVSPPRPGPPEANRNKRCRNARLVASGYVFRYPTFREGYRAGLDEMTE